MGKYIINFEDDPGIAPNGEKYYKCCEFPWWVATKGLLSELTPYTEPDLDAIREEAYDKGYTDAAYNCHERCAFLDDAKKEAYDKCMNEAEDLAYKLYNPKIDEAYQRGLNNAWEAARKIYLPEDHGGLGMVVVGSIFNTDNRGWIFKKMPVTEAIEKIRQYEQEQENKQEENKETCQNCKFAKNPKVQEPCVRCSHSFYNFFRAKVKESES